MGRNGVLLAVVFQDCFVSYSRLISMSSDNPSDPNSVDSGPEALTRKLAERLLDMTLPDECVPGVMANLDLLNTHRDILRGFDLPGEGD